MIKRIVYGKKDGSISEREILILEEDEGHYYALDKRYFSDEDWNTIQSVLKDRPVVEKSKDNIIEGFESSWFKGYRCFLKSSILPEQEEEQKEEE